MSRPRLCQVCGRAFAYHSHPNREGVAAATRYQIQVREFSIDEWEHEVSATMPHPAGIIVSVEVCNGCATEVADSVREKARA